MPNSRRTSLLLLGAAAIAVLAAEAGAQVTGSGIRVSKDTYVPSVSEGAVIDAPGFNAVDAEIYRTMTDANIMAHMIVGDSLEIEMARLAAERAGDPEVREFARMLVDEHTRHLATSLEMSRDEDIGSMPADGDRHAVTLRRFLSNLRSMNPSPAFDRAFLRFQIRHHDHEVNALNAMRPAARDNDLKQHIDETLPVIERHLNRARELGARLGVMGP
jgi:putative membrane protein